MRRSIPKQAAIVLFSGLLPCFLVLPGPRGIAQEKASERTIDRLIDHLGNGQFEIREAALRSLMEMEEAIPALRTARKSGDPEVRRRAVECLRALARKRAPRAMARAKLLGKAGRIVEVADRVAYWGILDSAGEGWDILTQFAEKVNVSTADHFPFGSLWHSSNCPKGDFYRYAANSHPREIAAPMIDMDAGGGDPSLKDRTRDARNIITYSTGMLLLRGRNITLKKKDKASMAIMYKGIVAASGEVQVEYADRSLIIAGGNVKINHLHGSIIVCDGDVELPFPGADNIIVARGKVTCLQEENRRGAIRGGSYKCVIRSSSCLELPGGIIINLSCGTPDPVAFVKFFELADVGLAAEALPQREESHAEGVRLEKVRKQSPFAAGLRAGDVITAIGEQMTPTAEILRKVLRRKLAQDEPTITFTVRRSDKTLVIPIPVKG